MCAFVVVQFNPPSILFSFTGSGTFFLMINHRITGANERPKILCAKIRGVSVLGIGIEINVIYKL